MSPPLIERKTCKTKKADSNPDSFRLEGYILIMIIDTVFPHGIALLNNIFDKAHKITASQLMLDEKAQKKLEPLADQAADYLSININPVAGFMIVSALMYSNNFIYIRAQITANEI